MESSADWSMFHPSMTKCSINQSAHRLTWLAVWGHSLPFSVQWESAPIWNEDSSQILTEKTFTFSVDIKPPPQQTWFCLVNQFHSVKPFQTKQTDYSYQQRREAPCRKSYFEITTFWNMFWIDQGWSEIPENLSLTSSQICRCSQVGKVVQADDVDDGTDHSCMVLEDSRTNRQTDFHNIFCSPVCWIWNLKYFQLGINYSTAL